MELAPYKQLEGCDHEFIIPTRWRVSDRFENVGFELERFSGFPNVLPFSWHRETFEKQLARLARKDGSIIEFGTAQGGSTRQLARLAPTRRVFTLDVFTGVPKEHVQEIDNRSPSGDGHVVDFTDWPLLPEHWKQFYPNVLVYEGLFADSMPRLAEDYPEAKFVLAYIDCNLYSSTQEALAFVTPRLVPGAAVVFDDYSGKDQCDGARKAADEWFTAQRSALRITDASSLEGEGLFILGE